MVLKIEWIAIWGKIRLYAFHEDGAKKQEEESNVFADGEICAAIAVRSEWMSTSAKLSRIYNEDDHLYSIAARSSM